MVTYSLIKKKRHLELKKDRLLHLIHKLQLNQAEVYYDLNTTGTDVCFMTAKLSLLELLA